jgi:predicted NACHT family NTPase
MLISTALLLDRIIRNSVCTPAKLPCRRVEVGYEIFTACNCINNIIITQLFERQNENGEMNSQKKIKKIAIF